MSSSDESAIRVERSGAVGTIVLDRPLRFNSLDVRTAQDLRRAALSLARYESVHCVVLLVTPEARREDHLQVLAELARRVGTDPRTQRRLYAAENSHQAWQILDTAGGPADS